MKHARLYFWLLTVLLGAGLLALFVIQNFERTTDLSINLFFFHRHLVAPVSVPLLLLGTFGVGGGVGFVAGFLLRGKGRGAGGSSLEDAWT